MPPTDPARIIIRRARPDEADFLSELALRSKAHWGYDAQFLEACRPLLTLTPAYIFVRTVCVLDSDETPVGFYALTDMHDGSAEIDMLFVEPDTLGCGFGTLLWRHAVQNAAALGFRRLSVESDPNAEGFYQRMGMTRYAERESVVLAGRMVPLLIMSLEAE